MFRISHFSFCFYFFIASKTKITEAKTTIQKSEMELKHISKQLSNKKNQSASSDSNYQKCKQEEKSKEAAIEKLKVNYRIKIYKIFRYIAVFEPILVGIIENKL